MNKRFLIASGGTGGHFYPGFVIGQTLRDQGYNVLFIVRKNDPATQILETHRLHYREIDFIGLPRSVNLLKHIKFFYKLCKALLQTRRIVRSFRPDVAVGTGGYISFPLIFVAHFMGVKTAVHDSNARLGLANRICSKFTNLFMLGFPIDQTLKNSVLTSTPIRSEFADPIDRKNLLENLKLNPSRKTALVVGGSQGAKNLNMAIVENARKHPDWQFIHITGERWYKILKQMHTAPTVAVLAYSHEIYALIKAADLVICRSGASTLAELIYCQKPAILVPFPHAAANHQYYNAQILEQTGCAVIVPDNEQLSDTLHQELSRFSTDKAKNILADMHQSYQQLTIPNPMSAAKNIAQLLCKL